jgi:multidrug efflux pump subunit AcrB
MWTQIEKEKTKRMKSRIRRGKSKAYSIPPVLVTILSVVMCALFLFIYIQHQRTGVNPDANVNGNIPATTARGLGAEKVTVKQIRQNTLKYDKKTVMLTVTIVGMGGTSKPEYLIVADSNKEYMRLYRSTDPDEMQQAENNLLHIIPCRLDIKKAKSIVTVVGTYNAVTNTVDTSEFTVIGTDNS